MLKRNLIVVAMLIVSLVIAINTFGQSKDKSKVVRYSSVKYQKAASAKSSILKSDPLKADVAMNPQLANQIYYTVAKVMAMNKTGKLEYVKFSTQCLVDKGAISKAEKAQIDSLIGFILNGDKPNAKKVFEQLKNSDNLVVKAVVGSISNDQGGVDVQSGADIGDAIGTVLGAIGGFESGGVAGAAVGATIGGKIGRAIGGLFDGKKNSDDDEGEEGDEGEDSGDDTGGGSGGEAARMKPKTPKKWITVDTTKWKCGSASY